MKTSIIIVLLIVFFTILNLTSFSKDIKNFFYLTSAPIQKVFWGVGDRVSDFFEAISDIGKLKESNEVLELRIQGLSAEIVRLKDLEKENKALREALDIDIHKEFEIVFAEITGMDIARDSVLINLGEADGIEKYMPVISSQKILLGRISQVYYNFSRVMLISNKESSFPVNIYGEVGEEMKLLLDASPPYLEEGVRVVYDTIEAIAKGKGNFQIKVGRIPLGAEIKDGDRTGTSALGGLFPSGILIGYIKNIEKLGVELFQQAEIQFAVEVRELRHVFVIIDF